MLLRSDSESLQDILPRLKIVLQACENDLATEGSDFWDHKNLLRYIILDSLNTVLQCFDSVHGDVVAGRSVPAAINARSMFEHLVTFEYCVMDCPDALALWVKKGLTNRIKSLTLYLRFDAEIDPWRVKGEPKAQQEQTRCKSLLACTPGNVTGDLPCFPKMRRVVFAANPEAKRIYRLSYQYLSGWVHPSPQGTPDVGVLAETARFSLWLIINRAMRICADEHLVGWEDRNHAQGIIMVCERHASVEDGDKNATSG